MNTHNITNLEFGKEYNLTVREDQILSYGTIIYRSSVSLGKLVSPNVSQCILRIRLDGTVQYSLMSTICKPHISHIEYILMNE